MYSEWLRGSMIRLSPVVASSTSNSRSLSAREDGQCGRWLSTTARARARARAKEQHLPPPPELRWEGQRWWCRRRRQWPTRSWPCVASASIADNGNGTGESIAAEHRAFTVAMKFGGTSVGSAERMKCVADIITSFPDEFPVVVLSAMGKTTNLLLTAGEDAQMCSSPDQVSQFESFQEIGRLHRSAAEELDVDQSIFLPFLDELEKLLVGICLMNELTPRAKDYLVSFGERMSTRLFAAYLQSKGVRSKQYDAWEVGFVSNDDFTRAEVCLGTYDKVRESFEQHRREHPNTIPVVTGFLARGEKTNAITTLGRGGSDLTATIIGAALKMREIQVWKDVDGVLSADPRIIPTAQPVLALSFEAAGELAYFGATVLHPKSMHPAQQSNIPVRVKNSFNKNAVGTVITSLTSPDSSTSLLTSIVIKKNVTLFDIVSTRMLGQYGFLAKVFGVFERNEISVDVVATSEVSISLTLDPSKIWSRELIPREIDNLRQEFGTWADVTVSYKRAIVSLICNVGRSSEVLERVFKVMSQAGVNAQMISQGASKVNISLIVDDSESELVARKIHAAFFECSDTNVDISLQSST